MVKSYPVEIRWRVVFLRNDNYSIKEIARTLRVGQTFVKKILSLYHTTLGVEYEAHHKGRPRIIKGQDNVLIRTLVDKYPEIYLDELRDWMHHITGKEYTITTLHRFLRKSGLTVKKMHVIARQRNELLRSSYRRLVSDFHQHQFLFIDESAKDDRTFQRKFGMCLKGCRLANHGNFTRGKRFSVLAAMAATGVQVAHSIIGSYDMSQFEFAFENFVLPLIGSFAKNEECSVLVLDNCTIHYSEKVIQMVREKGGLMVFLPLVLASHILPSNLYTTCTLQRL